MLVRTLGVLSVEEGGRGVGGPGLGGRRVRLALAALALERTTLTPDRLAEILWRDEPPPTWAVAVRGVIRELRSRLADDGSEVVSTVGRGYRIAADVRTDVDEGERALATAAELAAHGGHAEAVALAAPVARWHSTDLLPGEDADWLRPHRRRIDALAARAGALVVDSAGAAGDPDRAVVAARDLVARTPLDESAHRLLIAALGRAGNRAEAVQAYEACRSTLAEELGVDPSEATVEAYLAVLGEPTAPSATRMPTYRSSYVGRADERTLLGSLLSRPGLVSVTGPGGVGKSRLAAEAAPRGVTLWWVSMASVSDDALVPSTVAMLLGAPTDGGDLEPRLARLCAAAGRAVLVLDGCEQARDGVASLAAGLLDRCPDLTVLVTSRRALHAPAEATVALAALPEADELMRRRIGEAGGEPLPRDEADLTELVRRCAGLPLAVELTAAQLGEMSPADLVHQLDAGPTADSPVRTVAAGVYAMLDDAEATVFRRLAVLAGPVRLDLARQVVAGGSVPPLRVVRLLRELSAVGLLGVDRSGPHWYYQLDDDLRAYATELGDGAEQRAAYGRLADAVRGLLPEDAQRPPGAFRDAVSEVLESLRGLFTAALTGRADRSACLELAFRLHRYWAATNLDEGRFWLAQLLRTDDEVGTTQPWAPFATYALGYLDYWSGDVARAVPELQAVVTMLGERESPYVARALIYLGGLLDDLDRGEEAVEHVRRAIEAARPFGVDLQVSAAMGVGCVLAERCEPEAASHAAAAISLCREHGSVDQLAAALPTAAMVCFQVGDLAAARAFLDEARPLHEERRIARVVMLCVAAGVALADGDLERAVALAEEADADGTALGVDRELPLVRTVLARALLARGDRHGARDRAAAALEAGRRLEYDWPLALGLETAAGLLAEEAPALAVELAGAAAVIRRRGSRPPPATLRIALPPVPSDGPVDPVAAAKHAVALLRGD